MRCCGLLAQGNHDAAARLSVIASVVCVCRFGRGSECKRAVDPFGAKWLHGLGLSRSIDRHSLEKSLRSLAQSNPIIPQPSTGGRPSARPSQPAAHTHTSRWAALQQPAARAAAPSLPIPIFRPCGGATTITTTHSSPQPTCQDETPFRAAAPLLTSRRRSILLVALILLLGIVWQSEDTCPRSRLPAPVRLVPPLQLLQGAHRAGPSVRPPARPPAHPWLEEEGAVACGCANGLD